MKPAIIQSFHSYHRSFCSLLLPAGHERCLLFGAEHDGYGGVNPDALLEKAELRAGRVKTVKFWAAQPKHGPERLCRVGGLDLFPLSAQAKTNSQKWDHGSCCLQS